MDDVVVIYIDLLKLWNHVSCFHNKRCYLPSHLVLHIIQYYELELVCHIGMCTPALRDIWNFLFLKRWTRSSPSQLDENHVHLQGLLGVERVLCEK